MYVGEVWCIHFSPTCIQMIGISVFTYIELRISGSFRQHRVCYIFYQHSFHQHYRYLGAGCWLKFFISIHAFHLHTFFPTPTSLINIRTTISIGIMSWLFFMVDTTSDNSEKDKWVSHQFFLKILHLEIFDSIIVLARDSLALWILMQMTLNKWWCSCKITIQSIRFASRYF